MSYHCCAIGWVLVLIVSSHSLMLLQIIYYPIDAVLVPMSALDITSSGFTAYLEDLLVPNGPETPAGLVIDAVNRRQTGKVSWGNGFCDDTPSCCCAEVVLALLRWC